MVDKPAAPPYPASAYTLHKDDWNLMRSSLTTGEKGIWTKGILLGEEGIEFSAAETPIRMAAGMIEFLDADNDDAVVGSLSNDGQLSMTAIRVNQREYYAAGAAVALEGDRSLKRPSSARTHDTVVRGDAQIEDLDIFNDGDLFVLRALAGTFQSDALGHGFAWRNAGGVSQVYLNDSGNLILRDVVDPVARPWTHANERQIVTGLIGSELVADVLGVDGIDVSELTSSPRILQAGLLLNGVNADRLNVGPGSTQVNVDDLWNRGGGAGVAATLVTPAERVQIGDHETRLAALEAEIVQKISALRTAAGVLITPTVGGYVQLVDSSSVIFDRPGPNSLRGVSSGGGGGGGAVDSVTAGAGLNNSGTGTDPILNVNAGTGLLIDVDSVAIDFGTGHTQAARGDHDHAGVYSPVSHTHTGVYVPVGGAYADLSTAGKIGTGAGQVAAGNDVRFHTQNTDVGTSALTFILRDTFVGTPNNADVVGITANRGTDTDARIYFHETDDKWVAGLEGSEAAIILEGDARLSDARTPTAHSLVSHTGQLPGARTLIALVPANYVAGSTTIEGHLSGIDAALGSAVLSSDGELGGQLITASALSASLLVGATLLGDGGVHGLPILTDGTVNRLVVQAQTALAFGSSVTFKLTNLTVPAHNDTITIVAGDIYESKVVSIIVNAGDEVGVSCTALVGAPNGGLFNFYAVKGA